LASTTRFLVCILLFAAPARADDISDAQAEMEKAQEDLERGEFEAAIGRFNVARSLVKSSSGPYLGLGLAYARMGHCEQAIPYLEEYLRRKRSNPKPEAQTTLAECRSRAVAPTGKIIVTSEPPGAEVRFDDMQGPILGVTPFESQPMAPGRHRVFVARSGYRGASGDVVVNAGERATFTVALVTEMAPPPPQVMRIMPPPQPIITAPPIAPQPQGAPGKLVVEVGPVGAAISVNGSQVAKETRRYEGSQASGNVRILVEKEGYRAAAAEVQLSPNATEKRTLTLQPLKRSTWLGVGVGFTVVALAAGVGALASYVIANEKPRDTSAYRTDKNATLALQGIFYPTLALAAVGYIVYGVTNRGRVADGPPLRAHLDPRTMTLHF
jgi:hypothetical protein